MRRFGSFLRDERKAKGIGLRQLARQAGISAPYLCKIETGEFAPPALDKLLALAAELKIDSDVLIAEAGRIPADVLETMKRKPLAMCQLVRAAGELMQ